MRLTTDQCKELTGKGVIPVHLDNVDELIETEKQVVPDFINTFTFQVPDPFPNPSDPFQKILELDLLREEAVITVTGQPVTRNNHVNIPAGGNTNFSLSSNNFDLTGLDLTLSAAGTAAGTVTIANVLGGSMVYDIPIGATSLTLKFSPPLMHDPAQPNPIKVTISVITGSGTGHANAYSVAEDGLYAFLCNSLNQANACAKAITDAAGTNNGNGTVITSYPVPGALVTPGSYRVRGSAPLWVMPAQNTVLSVSVVEVKRRK